MDRGDGAMAVSTPAHVLVVAGTDSSGGAGLVRDVETVAALGGKACCAVTAVTVQTHEGVERVAPVPADAVAAQMRAALRSNPVGAIKLGMLGGSDTILAVAAVLAEWPDVPVVLDPVAASTSGHALLDETARETLLTALLPHCLMVTPNLDELDLLCRQTNYEDPETLGRRLLDFGCNGVVIKGGHAAGESCDDLLLRKDRPVRRFAGKRLPGRMRGTGCMLASGIATRLAAGAAVEKAIAEAKAHVAQRWPQDAVPDADAVPAA